MLMPRSLNSKRSIILIAHDIRSAHNVGSIFRTAEGLGVDLFILSGYTPYPKHTDDKRPPHISAKLDKQIYKTALGAQKYLKWKTTDSLMTKLADLKAKGYEIVALEQDQSSVPISNYQPSNKIALIIGNEVSGLGDAVLKSCDTVIEIPMLGKKESFNVVQALAMALFKIVLG
ncbi:MAG: TrmH family RNA methyltransferase [Candidatus Saccharimonadales bacterium]